MPARGKDNNKYFGSKWITRARRLAIYMRDGLACVYCGASVEEGTQLSLDHVIPHSEGGSTKSENLLTSCKRCNSSRGNRSVEAFVEAVAAYLNHGITGAMILQHITETRIRNVDIKSAKALIAKRGGFTQALQA